MIPMKLSEIARLLNVEFSGDDRLITGISTDSRTVSENELFVSIVGEKFDAHDFITQINCAASLCERECPPTSFPQLRVKSCVEALGKIASYNARLSNPKCVITLTGSVGKTTTKEMCALVCEKKYKTLKTAGNFNNHIGVPKTLLALDESYGALVCEMGMSHAGEIAYLSGLVDSDIAIITNIGNSHIENLKSRENIAKAKSEITAGLKKDGILLVNGDEKLLENIEFPGKIIRVGMDSDLSVCAKNIVTHTDSVEFDCVCFGKTAKVRLPVPGKHNVHNALFAITVAHCIGVEPNTAAEALEKYVPAGMRQHIYNVGNSTVIADCYNAGVESMTASLETLSDMSSGRLSIAVLGDMLELGDMSEKLHRRVGETAAKTNTDILVCVGNKAEFIKNSALKHGLKEAYYFKTHEEAAKFLSAYRDKDAVILFKASRAMQFEKLAEISGFSEK